MINNNNTPNQCSLGTIPVAILLAVFGVILLTVGLTTSPCPQEDTQNCDTKFPYLFGALSSLAFLGSIITLCQSRMCNFGTRTPLLPTFLLQTQSIATAGPSLESQPANGAIELSAPSP